MDLNKEEWDREAFEKGVAEHAALIDLWEQEIAQMVAAGDTWASILSFKVTEHGITDIKRRPGRPKGSKDSYQRKRHWVKKPDMDEVITVAERGEDGELHTVRKKRGEVIGGLLGTTQEHDITTHTPTGELRDRELLPPGDVPVPVVEGDEVELPVAFPEVSTSVDEAPVVAPFRLNFKKVNGDD